MAKNNRAINLSIKITDKDMFTFMTGHVYGKLSGKLSLTFSIICLVVFPFSLQWNDTLMTLVLLFGALIYLVITPLMLFLQSKKQVATIPVFANEIAYKINEDGISVLQEGEWIEFRWENLSRVIETRSQLLFYIAKDQAFIVPKRFIDNEKHIQLIRDMASAKMKPKRIKVRTEKTQEK